MTNAQSVINHLTRLKTWSRFVTGAEISAIDYLLTTIPSKNTSITNPQYDAFLKLSGAIFDRFRQAPEGDIMWEVLNLQYFLSNDDGKTVAALLAAFVNAPIGSKSSPVGPTEPATTIGRVAASATLRASSAARLASA